MSLHMVTVADQRVVRMRAALVPHVDHPVTVNGYPSKVPNVATCSDEQLAWRFLGFAVRCTRCQASLSENWNN